MTHFATLIVSALAAVLALAGLAQAQPAETPAAEETLLLVHVRNGSTGHPADVGLPVILSAEAHGQWVDILEARTAPGGVARFAISAAMAGRVAFRCTVTYQGYDFFSPPFQVAADRPMNMVPVTLYEPLPRLGLPPWTAAALAVIFALAMALIAFRKSDRQLT